MSECVLDCSLALAWVLPGERSKRADRLLAQASARDVFWVPALWWYELANGLTMAQRRRRLAELDGRRVVELFGMLPIQTDTLESPHPMQNLAQAHGLSAYDAAYLELAQRRGVGLATLDGKLSRVARKIGLQFIRL